MSWERISIVRLIQLVQGRTVSLEKPVYSEKAINSQGWQVVLDNGDSIGMASRWMDYGHGLLEGEIPAFYYLSGKEEKR